MAQRTLAFLSVFLLLLGAGLSGTPAAEAAPSLGLPFAAGISAKIIQGYHGGTHNGVDPYAIDIVVANGTTTGAAVVAPASGSVTWTSGGPWAGNGCMTMALDSGFRLMMCHIIFDRSFRRGERLGTGQRIGYVGPAGTVGNNGTPHVHLDLSSGGRSAPFSSGWGLPLNGVELPPRGRGNDYGGTVIPAGGGRVAAADTRTTAGATSSRGATTRPATLSGTVVVSGTGDCLNVRSAPGLGGRIVACLPDGTRGTIVEGPETASGMQWYRLSGRGWVAGDYLRPAG